MYLPEKVIALFLCNRKVAACEGDHWDQRRKALLTRKLAGNIRQPWVREGIQNIYSFIFRGIEFLPEIKNCVGIKGCKDFQCSYLICCAQHRTKTWTLCSFKGEYTIDIYVLSYWAFSCVLKMGTCLTGLQLINYYVNNKYTLRYTGGMVPDVNQVHVLSNLSINCLSWMRFWKVGICLHPGRKSAY